MDCKERPDNGDPFIQRLVDALEHVPPKERIAALKEMKQILDGLTKTEEQLRNADAAPNLRKLLSSDSRELRRLVHKNAKRRFLEWFRSLFQQRIEVEEGRSQIESLEESMRGLDIVESDLEALGLDQTKLNELTQQLGMEPIELLSPERDSEDDNTEVTEAMRYITETYHKNLRSLINPWPITRFAYRLEIRMWAPSVARGAVMLFAGMMIFRLGGLAHKLPEPKWYAAALGVSLVVTIMELLAHRGVEHWMHKWERRDVHRLPNVLAKARIFVVVNNALAKWAADLTVRSK